MRINRGPPLADSVPQNLKRTFILNSGIRPLGLLRSCKEYALNDKTRIDGVSTQENPGSYPPRPLIRKHNREVFACKFRR